MRDFQIVVQLIDKKTGSRTPPIIRTRAQFADLMRELLSPSEHDKAYVLVLADDSVAEGSLDFAFAPLMTVSSFIENFATKEGSLNV